MDDPVVTHEGEFDIGDQDSLDFAIAFETALFKKQAGNNPVNTTVVKENRKLKNLVGRMFTIGDNQAVLEEDTDGYYFRIFNPVTGDTIVDLFLGDDGEKSYRVFKYEGERFTLIKDNNDPADSQPKGGVTSSSDGLSSVNNDVQNIEDQKEAAIRDEKQKLKWQEGKRVMYVGLPGVIQKTEDDDTLYFVKIDNGLEFTLGPGESKLDEYPGLTLVPEGSNANIDNVPVEDRVFAIEFTSDDRSTVNIDGKEFTIVRNPETGGISGLQYQTKSGPR